MARLLRGILKQGRRFKPVRNAPVLIDDEWRFTVDKQETSQMLSLHFASAERGVISTPQAIQNSLRPVSATGSEVET